MYLTLTISLLLEYKNQKVQKSNVLPLISICVFFPVLLGGLIEIFQPILSQTRSASWLDLAFNILGVILGWTTFYGYYRIFEKRK
jgi:VanZ family protein